MEPPDDTAPAWQRWAAVLPAVVWWAALTAGTHWPRAIPFSSDWAWFDKAQHLAAFAGLAALTAFALNRWRALSLLDHAALAAILLVLSGADELTQQLVPGRSCELADWLADVTGIVLGLGLFAAGRAIAPREA